MPVVIPRSQDPVDDSERSDSAARLEPMLRGDEVAEVLRGGMEVGLEGWDMLQRTQGGWQAGVWDDMRVASGDGTSIELQVDNTPNSKAVYGVSKQ